MGSGDSPIVASRPEVTVGCHIETVSTPTVDLTSVLDTARPSTGSGRGSTSTEGVRVPGTAFVGRGRTASDVVGGGGDRARTAVSREMMLARRELLFSRMARDQGDLQGVADHYRSYLEHLNTLRGMTTDSSVSASDQRWISNYLNEQSTIRDGAALTEIATAHPPVEPTASTPPTRLSMADRHLRVLAARAVIDGHLTSAAGFLAVGNTRAAEREWRAANTELASLLSVGPHSRADRDVIASLERQVDHLGIETSRTGSDTAVASSRGREGSRSVRAAGRAEPDTGLGSPASLGFSEEFRGAIFDLGEVSEHIRRGESDLAHSSFDRAQASLERLRRILPGDSRIAYLEARLESTRSSLPSVDASRGSDMDFTPPREGSREVRAAGPR